jgi:hypothetical protein
MFDSIYTRCRFLDSDFGFGLVNVHEIIMQVLQCVLECVCVCVCVCVFVFSCARTRVFCARVHLVGLVRRLCGKDVSDVYA